MLLLAVTWSPAKVLMPGLVLLPATRRTWIAWVRLGLGTRWTLVAAVPAALVAGFAGVVAVCAVSAAVGAIRSGRRPLEPPADRAGQ